MRKIAILVSVLLFTHCQQKAQNTTTNINTDTTKNNEIELAESKPEDKPKIISEIPLPQNYTRIAAEKGSFAEYLRNLPLRQNDNTVYLFNGQKKENQNAQYAVVDMEIGTKDLQQCADAIMRLRGEYLFAKKQYNKIHFNFTNGMRVDLTKYQDGYRTSFQGNKLLWNKTAKKDTSYQNFRNYMNLIFMYAGTASLEKELIPVNDLNSIQIGDIYIEGGFPGHSVIVVDMATHNETGEKIFLVAQSYMPAQDIHVLINMADQIINPWYKTEIKDLKDILITPEYVFKKHPIKRFKDE